MFSFFRKKSEAPDLSNAPRDFSFLGTDMHSHLVPGIDDGSPNPENSLAMISAMKALGWSKLITTPHVHQEFYENKREKIELHFAGLKNHIKEQGLDMELEIAAEYFLDNSFLHSVLPDGLLTIGSANKYVLVEVSMAGWPHSFSEIIFTIQSSGFIPVLAHPERYLFEDDVKVYAGWKSKGMLLQMNLLSVTGYYGKSVKLAALRYMDSGLYDFCGSDAHHLRHLEVAARMAAEQPELMLKLSEYPHWRNSSL